MPRPGLRRPGEQVATTPRAHPRRPAGTVTRPALMSWTVASATALVVAACLTGEASAQGTGVANQGAAGNAVRDAQAGHPPSAAAMSRAFGAMKGDLQRLVSANEVYHAKSGQYSKSVGALQGYHPSAGVTVTIVQSSGTGWAAQATDPGVPGMSCVIFIGSVSPIPATLHDKRSGPEAVATCDGSQP